MNKRNSAIMERKALPRMWLHARGQQVKSGTALLRSAVMATWLMVAFCLFFSIVLLVYNWHLAFFALMCAFALEFCLSKLDDKLQASKTQSLDLSMSSVIVKLIACDHML